MTNTTRDVQRVLDHDVVIRRGLSRGIINRKALAEYLKGSGVYGTTDAIMSAIRRYEGEFKQEEKFGTAEAIIKDAKISTRTGIAIVAMAKDSSVQSSIPKLFTIIHYDKGEALRVVQAEESIKVIVDEKNVAKVIELMGQNKIIRTDKKLAEITMKLSPLSAKAPGVLAILNNELAANDINILEEVSCVPEVLFFIDQKDLLKAHKTFLELISSLQ